MSKRKAMVGGYEESSDDQLNLGESPERPPKRPPPAAYAPPRLTTASKSGLGAFQLPGATARARVSVSASRHVSVSSTSSRRATPAIESIHSTRNSPDIQILESDSQADSNLIRRGSTVEPTRVSNPAAPNDMSKPILTNSYNKTNGGRSNLALERQLNELTKTFEEYKHASEGTLARILEAVNRWDPASNQLASRSSTPCLTATANSTDVKPLLSNPPPTPELVSLVSKVVSEARSRVGKKKGGADDNSCKEHARNTFYRMLGILAASEIRPFFEDEYGEPDTLPAQFVDPDTKYCRPYPHWKASLARQTAWIPTYILQFRTTVPNDQSELSNVLRNLSDEQILILLNDGPFKSACTAWRNAKKTDLEIEAMRSSARRYQRCDRKVAVRTTYIRTIPSLQGSEWEYLYQPGYMSQDESDKEGHIITKRPEHRTRWETNLYEAIHVAEREKAKARPGLCPRLPPSRVEIVRRPIPHLERGTGSGKVTTRIALCGVSKTWREKYPSELQKAAHLLNMKMSEKPDINAFLSKHPMPKIEDSESVKDEPQADDDIDDRELWAYGTQVEGELSEGYGHGLGLGIGDYGDVASECTAEENPTRGTSSGLEEASVTGATDALESLTPEGKSNDAHIPIDPVLLPDSTFNGSTRSSAKARPSLSASQDTSSARLPPLGSDMPPPPPLANDLGSVRDDATIVNDTPIDGKAKKGKAMDVEASAVTDAVPVAPKRRGRPPGSKNKPKKT